MFEDLPALSPIQFFGLNCDFHYLKKVLKPAREHLLPATSDLLDEEEFAVVYGGWGLDRLSFFIEVNVPFQKVVDNDPRKGDSIELFIDTRDLKTKGTISRFCHHFVFFPARSQNHFGKEITRMRNEDVHRICDPDDLEVRVDMQKISYSMKIDIPAHCLFGYEPLVQSRLGFTYQINRTGGPPQHFSISSEEYTIEQHPATWGTLQLIKGNEG